MSLPQLAVIEYPGAVVDMDRATQTLQYIPPRQGEKERMLLGLNPHDTEARPIAGTCMQVKDKVLLRVRLTQDPNGIKKVDLLEPIGVVSKLVRFRKMAEYGYDVQVPEDWASLANGICNLDCDAMDRMTERILAEPRGLDQFYAFPPPVPSHFDHPAAILGPDVFIAANRQSRGRGRTNAAEVRGRLPWLVSFGDIEVPRSPATEALARTPTSTLPSPTISALQAMFESRPIVSRLYAAHVSGLGYADLAKILPAFAYCFVDGPWRNCWVRYGIDPRSSPDYRVYQLVQCRNNLISEGLVEATNEQEPAHLFTGASSGAHFSQFQFCDLQYPPLQAIVQERRGLQATCQKQEGWYPAKTYSTIRQIIRRRWMEVLREANPSAYARFAEFKAKKTGEEDVAGEDEEVEEEEDEEEEFEYYDE